jgi:hypothetical protein
LKLQPFISGEKQGDSSVSHTQSDIVLFGIDPDFIFFIAVQKGDVRCFHCFQPSGNPGIRLPGTLLLFEKGNFLTSEKFSQKSPLPPLCKGGLGADFSDGYLNRYGFDMNFKLLNLFGYHKLLDYPFLFSSSIKKTK